MLGAVRAFFAARDVLEVDCPLLSRYPSIDAHIDLISATYQQNTSCYLHSSPEYGMKRLLSSGSGDIYQLSHVFRDGEYGSRHNPEFMMAEWYRIGWSLDQLIAEAADFCRLFLGSLPLRVISYRQLFKDFCHIDCAEEPLEKLQTTVEKQGLPKAQELDRDTCLQLILQQEIEPCLGKNEIVAVTNYPASQAALAQTTIEKGQLVARRFELYHEGVELANGYHELGDAQEQYQRFQNENRHREELGKKPLGPIDERFLKALERGLPDCCGVAVGFDRLMMLRHKQSSLRDIMPFVWDTA